MSVEISIPLQLDQLHHPLTEQDLGRITSAAPGAHQILVIDDKITLSLTPIMPDATKQGSPCICLIK